MTKLKLTSQTVQYLTFGIEFCLANKNMRCYQTKPSKIDMRLYDNARIVGRVRSDGRHRSAQKHRHYRQPSGIDHAKVDYERLTTQDVFPGSDRSSP